MKAIITILILLGASLNAWSADTTVSQYTILESAPAGHSNIVAGRTWSQPIAYGEGDRINCNSSLYEEHADCYFGIDVFQYVPPEAVAVKLLVKAKTWAMTGPGADNRCLLFAKVTTGPAADNNHFVHSEVWGYADEQRRRVTYSTIDAPIYGNSVLIDVGREIIGQCVAEMAIYLEGYWE